jgi:hypothetical protein
MKGADWQIQLDVSQMNDAELGTLVATIQKNGAGSSLQQNAAIHASFTALGTKATTLATSASAVAALEQQRESAAQARTNARAELETEVRVLRALVTNNATDAADAVGMGFSVRVPQAQTRTTPPAPAVVLVRPSKTHGRARATVEEAAGVHGAYLAESSPDPIGASSVWTYLPGIGKSRTITGATGARVWVRFAQVKYGLQSDWSTPVLVTLP